MVVHEEFIKMHFYSLEIIFRQFYFLNFESTPRSEIKGGVSPMWKSTIVFSLNYMHPYDMHTFAKWPQILEVSFSKFNFEWLMNTGWFIRRALESLLK